MIDNFILNLTNGWEPKKNDTDRNERRFENYTGTI